MNASERIQRIEALIASSGKGPRRDNRVVDRIRSIYKGK